MVNDFKNKGTQKIDDFLSVLQKLKNDSVGAVVLAEKELKNAKSGDSICNNLLLYYKNKWPIHLLRLFEQESSYFKGLRTSKPDVANVLESIYFDAKKSAEDTIRQFPLYFENKCAIAGIDIDKTSRHPQYRVCENFIEIKISDSSMRAELYDREGKLEDLLCDIGALIEVIKKHKQRLFNRKFVAQKFISYLYKQYIAILKKEGLADGDDLPIRRITSRLGKNVKGFRTDEFLIDISRLIKEDTLVVEGKRLDLKHTKDTRQGMLLHGFENRGYIGFISFRKE